MTRWRTTLLALLEVGALGGCGVEPEPDERYACVDPEPWPAGNEGSAYERCESGLVHRPAAGGCAPSDVDPPRYEPAPGYPRVANENFQIGGGCATDGDCTEMPFGHCTEIVRSGPEPTTRSCSYSCANDDDCAEDHACVCGTVGGECVPADCRTNEDCGGAPCMLVFLGQVCGEPSGLALSCGAAGQECVAHEGCATFEFCQNGSCEPSQNTCGRPFLVQGRDLRAAPRGSSEWLEHIAPLDLTGLTSDERQRLGEDWTRLGLMEHASVAAFSRFVLQLLSLGAPASLVEAAQQALVDETRHAKSCFALAAAYLGRPVGPGPLSVTHALEDSDVAAIFETAFFEACVGETCAAIEAADRAEREADPVVTSILRGIAEDEARHAALGWSFASWMIMEFGPRVAPACASLPEAVTRQLASSSRLRATAIRDVVLPCLERLLNLCRQPAAPSGPCRHSALASSIVRRAAARASDRWAGGSGAPACSGVNLRTGSR